MLPYDLFVRFLVTKGLSDVDDINDCLVEYGLFPISPLLAPDLVENVHNSLPSFISDQIESKTKDGQFFKAMAALDVQEMWCAEFPFCKYRENIELAREIRTILDINYDPQLRHCLRALIYKRAPEKDITQAIQNKFSFALKESHIILYKKFFWNPDIMRRKDWKDYIALCGPFEQNLLFTALSSDINDVKAILGLPNTVDLTTSYQRLFAQIQMKASQYLTINTPDANREARNWISTLIAVGDKYKKYEKGNADDFGKMLQLQFDYTENNFPDPDDVTRKLIEANKPNFEQEEPSSGE